MNREQFEEATELLKQRDALSSWLDSGFTYKITPPAAWAPPLTSIDREHMKRQLEVAQMLLTTHVLAAIEDTDDTLLGLGLELEPCQTDITGGYK